MGLFANIANGWKLFSKLHLRCFTGYWKASAVYRFKTDKILTVTEFTQIHWKYTLKVLKSTLRKIMLQTLNIATSISEQKILIDFQTDLKQTCDPILSP